MIKKKKISYVFLFLYFLSLIFLRNLFININGWNVSIVMLLGFIIIIVVFFIFINSKHEKGNYLLYHFHFLSENLIKFFFLILISIVLFIPPILDSRSLILWEELPFLNYFRALIVLLVCAYLPGANLYKILFPKDIVSDKLNIESFFVKITLYPLISFGFIGINILIFDQIGLIMEQMEILLFIAILILFLIDIGLQIKRNDHLKLKITKIEISKYTFIILLLSFAVLTISIGFQTGWKYLTSGDPWDAIKYANHIGEPNKSPIYIDKYPNFWGYITYGLSIFSGLPYININSLLAPFSYLFITSVYIFMKSILSNHKTEYAVFSTLLISLFSGFFVNLLVFSLISAGEFYFIYRSYSFLLFFTSLALFFMILDKNSESNFRVNRLWQMKELKIIILGTFFLILSYMTYLFPLLFGILFLGLFCLFSEKSKKYLNFNYFIIFTFFTFIFLIIFDIIQNFYLSFIITEWVLAFFKYEFLITIKGIFPPPLLVYPMFLLFIFIIFILNQKLVKLTVEKDKRVKFFNANSHKIFKILLIIFTFFLVVTFLFFFLETFILNIELSDEFFFLIFLDKIYLHIGFVGSIGIYLSYYCFKKSKELFYKLLAWIIITYSLALLLFFLEMIINYPLAPKSIPTNNYDKMNHWFNRIWIYSIPSLCIFTSIGLFRLFNKLKRNRIFVKHKFLIPISKNLVSLSLIILSFSGIIVTGVLYGNANFRYDDNQVNTLEWTSKNIPIWSGVLVGDNFFMGVGVDSITFVRQYFMYDIFEADFNETQCIKQIEYLKNETIQYAIFSQFFISYYLNKSDFTNYILIPQFYNVTLEQFGDLSIHYAPYFD